MHPNAQVIERFYQAFQQRDADGMAACYHAQVQFSDPVFPDLRGRAAGEMWRMLCAGGPGLRIEFRDVQADAQRGSVHWEAWYDFSMTGRKVHNLIDSRFEFREGLILRHTDEFDFHRWATQTLGLPGRLLGGTQLLRNKVRGQAAAKLDAWIRNPQV